MNIYQIPVSYIDVENRHTYKLRTELSQLETEKVTCWVKKTDTGQQIYQKDNTVMWDFYRKTTNINLSNRSIKTGEMETKYLLVPISENFSKEMYEHIVGHYSKFENYYVLHDMDNNIDESRFLAGTLQSYDIYCHDQ